MSHSSLRFVIHAISVFSVKFTMEVISWAMNFSIEESKENDLIIKAATGNIKMRTIPAKPFIFLNRTGSKNK